MFKDEAGGKQIVIVIVIEIVIWKMIYNEVPIILVFPAK